jgi:CRP/FNR family transcriptional regulator, cyclic AMP receptor protein
MISTDVLRQADLFFDMSEEQLASIAAVCRERAFMRGDVIFKENDISSELYIVADGEVEIRLDPEFIGQTGEPQTLATLRRGQSFGEVALIDQGTRSASAHCTHGNTLLFVVRRTDLITLCEQQPRLGYQLMLNLAVDLSTKIRNIDIRVREHILYANKKSD